MPLMLSRASAPSERLEVLTGRYTETPVARISMASLLSCGVSLSKEEHAFMARLFSSPVSLSKTGFSSWEDLRRITLRVDNRFKRAYGHKAFVTTYPLGEAHERSCAFRFIGLNPELFEIDSQATLPGRDYLPQDFLGKQEYAVFKFLITNNNCPQDVIFSDCAVSEGTTRSTLHTVLIKKCENLGLPKPVLYKGNHLPKFYYVNPIFCELFGILPKNWKPDARAFGLFGSQLITYLLNHHNQDRGEISRGLGWSDGDVRSTMLVCDDNARCLGLPKPFACSSGAKGSVKHIRLSESFARALGLKLIKTLECYFTEPQQALIGYLAAHPFCRSQDIVEAMGLEKPDQLRWLNKTLARTCRECRLPLPVQRVGEYLLLEPTFARRFRIDAVAPNPGAVLEGMPGQVYRYFQDHPHATIAQAAQRLGLPEEKIRVKLNDAHIRLRKFGLMHNGSSKELLVSQFASFYVALGRWPTRQDMSRYKRGELVRKANKFGGFEAVVEEARSGFPNPRMIQGWLNTVDYYGRKKVCSWNYSKYGNREDEVRSSFLLALQRAATLRDLFFILSHCQVADSVSELLAQKYGLSSVHEKTVGSFASSASTLVTESDTLRKSFEEISSFDLGKFSCDSETVRRAFYNAAFFHRIPPAEMQRIYAEANDWSSAIRSLNALIE